MLRSLKDISSYPLECMDGSIGKSKDCLFNDYSWMVRYLVVDTGNWLPGRKVLVNTVHAKQPQVGAFDRAIPVALKKQHIEECPELEANEPVTLQYEKEMARYYERSPASWVFSDMFRPSGEKKEVVEERDEAHTPEEREEHRKRLEAIENSHLQSLRETTGFQIDALDDEFGHVEDLIIDDHTWKIRFLVVATRRWLPGRHFLVDVDWVKNLDWKNRCASVRLSRNVIEQSPKWDPHQPINKGYLGVYYDYYGLPQPKDKDQVMVKN